MNIKTEKQETQEALEQDKTLRVLKARIKDLEVDILEKNLYDEEVERAEF
jgi:hypothetical protein